MQRQAIAQFVYLTIYLTVNCLSAAAVPAWHCHMPHAGYPPPRSFSVFDLNPSNLAIVMSFFFFNSKLLFSFFPRWLEIGSFELNQ
jgi:hypothetical protein